MPNHRKKRPILRAVASLALLGGAFLALASCAVMPAGLGTIDAHARLDALDRPWPGLERPISIHWDEHLIPSIHAESDADAAFGLGLVHAHLRLSQMELFRKVSQGRLAEMAGPLAAPVDAGIRAIDLDRAVPEMAESLPPETRVWIERYVEGLNAYRDAVDRRPPDAVALGLTFDEPWTVEDVLTFGRLASVDVHWGRWISILALRDEDGYDDFISRLWAFGDAGIPSFGPETETDLSILTDIGRTGSNAVVVSAERSASRGALVATDPHLGIPIPNLWAIVGYRTPERAAVGLTLPGLPFILVGRNEQISWTGTNMQASSSVLYRLPEDWAPVGRREEPIGVRFWLDRTAAIRESAFGPVVTDASVLERLGEGDIAMTWRGHFPSDEASAFLRASRATSWDEFRAAFGSYAVSGQNMLYADAEGNIGQVMALEAMPAAAAASRLAPVPVDDAAFVWSPGAPSPTLPFSYNPDAGFLVSANNIPTPTTEPLVPQGNSNDRVARLIELLSGEETVTMEKLAELQLDTYSIAAHAAARALLARLDGAELSSAARAMLAEFAAWDGRHDVDTVGAATWQRVLDRLIDDLYAERYTRRIRNTIRSAPYVHDFVREDLEAADLETLIAAVEAAGRGWKPGVAWGEIHRLRVAHPIANVPLVGGWYTFGDHPYAGSTTTILKAAHGVGDERHNTRFGANARLLMDMGALDDNRVVLLGGQDGWMGSDRLVSQVPLWLDGGYAPLPLSAEAQAEAAVTTLRLAPAGAVQ